MKLCIAKFQSSTTQAGLCIAQFQLSVSVLTAQTVSCAVFAINLLTSRENCMTFMISHPGMKNVNFEMGTLAKKPRENIKNNAKNGKCVYWNDGFFSRVNFEHVLKMAVKMKLKWC